MTAGSDQKMKVAILWAGLLICIICLFILGYLFLRTDKQQRQQILRLEQIIAEQASAAEQSRRENLMRIMSGLFEQADRELAQSPSRKLSDETIGRLAILSDELMPGPYTYIEDDSLSAPELSPERGFLLKTLIAMHPDSGTWEKIKGHISFARANLEQANLMGVNLKGANLKSASLKGADLRNALLDSADLRGANLWGARLQRASGRHARMNRADLRWANLDSTDLREAVLDGCFLEGAKLREANLEKSIAAYAFFQKSMFGRANLSGIRLFKTRLVEADFNHANLQDADLRECDLSGANFRHANLGGALFRNSGVRESNWMNLLDTWKVDGSDSIRLKYRVIQNPAFPSGFALVAQENADESIK